MGLEISHLSKTYPNGTQALKAVSLSIPKGMFGLLGPNGAGKSTLMRTIATLQDADAGSINLDGLDVLRQKQQVREILGYLPQEFGVYPRVSALTMLDHFARLKGIHDPAERKQIVQMLLQKTNLWAARHKHLGSFSGGMKQRFGIAQALLGDPQLIIVDEPTAGLDPVERNRFHNLLSEIGENIVIILSTHIIVDVSSLCQRFAIIHQGEVVLDGTPNEAVAAFTGKIWRKVIDKHDLDAHKAEFPVISDHLTAGQVEVRAYAAAQPAGFAPAAADLEDVYFAYISGKITAPAYV